MIMNDKFLLIFQCLPKCHHNIQKRPVMVLNFPLTKNHHDSLLGEDQEFHRVERFIELPRRPNTGTQFKSR